MTTRITTFILVILASCNPSSPDLRQHVDGWGTITTFKVLPNREITVIDKQPQIVQGNNNVLIVELETKPIFKPGHELTDLHSIRSLLIELNQIDTVVRPGMLGSSKLYRRVVAFSPQYGTNNIGKNEKIEIRKISQNNWAVTCDLIDFKFSGHFNFSDSTVVTSVQKQMYD